MKVHNMRSSSGKEVPNQFIITDEGRGALGNFLTREVFQSYQSVIAVRTVWEDETRVVLDENFWNYSTTTAKYRNKFLGEGIEETRKKIASGQYSLENLNKGK